MNIRKKTLVTLLALAIVIGFGQPTSAVDCFACEFVDISDPADGGGPDRRPTCFAWGDEVGWSLCQEMGNTCLLMIDCFLFDF